MDQSFFLRAKRLLEQSRPLDHRALTQALQARQAASPTAAAASRYRDRAPADDDPFAICALLQAEQGWRRAVQLQGGCFNRAVAARRVNGS